MLTFTFSEQNSLALAPIEEVGYKNIPICSENSLIQEPTVNQSISNENVAY